MNESTKDGKAILEFMSVARKVNDGNYTGLNDHKKTIAGNDYFCNVCICEDCSEVIIFQDIGREKGLWIGAFDI